MNAILMIDRTGRIVVPKELREELHLTAGTRLSVERQGDRLVLTPVLAEGRLVIENGMPVIYPADPEAAPVVTNEMVQALIGEGRLGDRDLSEATA